MSLTGVPVLLLAWVATAAAGALIVRAPVRAVRAAGILLINRITEAYPSSVTETPCPRTP